MGANFVYDDNVQILENPWVKDIWRLPDIFFSSSMSFLDNRPANTYRPFVYVVYMAEYLFFGLKPWGWHLVNMVLHSLNVVMVFTIAYFLCGVRWARGSSGVRGSFNYFTAFFAALVFGLHPINSEVVSWVGTVPELAYTLFLLVAFYLYIRAEGAGRSRPLLYIFSVFCFFIALLSKETAMALVIIIPIYEITDKGRGFLKRWRVMLPYFATAALYMFMRTYALGGVMQMKQIDLGFYEVVVNVFPLISRYVGKLLVPVNLSVIYSYDIVRSMADPMAVIGLLVATVVAVVVFLTRRIKPVFFFLIWIFVPLIPVFYIPAVSVGGFADRYLYLSSAGFAVILGVVFSRFAPRRDKGGLPGKEEFHPGRGKLPTAAMAAAVVLLIVYSAASWHRSRVWKNDYNLWSDTIVKSPGSANAHYNLGWALHRMGEYDRAEAEYKAALTLAPNKEEAHYNLALIYTDRGDFKGAARHYKESIRLKPRSYGAYYNLAVIYQKMGRGSESIALYNAALRLAPGNDDIHYNLAWAYQERDDLLSALIHYKEAARLNPSGADTHYNMGIIYQKLDFPVQAEAEFRETLKLDPDYAPARMELDKIRYLKTKDR
ncbi:MAG: tetratricopeptide repeat protein [Thermodesulfobacteriota bacterium]|nr:MAG: tetratricopeptide repeat protein [Thermodesulfobacteriota bacterium]